MLSFLFSSLHAKGRRIFLFFLFIMGEELVWACKNGDLDQVKAIVDKVKVRKSDVYTMKPPVVCGCVKSFVTFCLRVPSHGMSRLR